MLGGTARTSGLRATHDDDGRVEVARATEAASWARRWRGWAEWHLTAGIVALAAVAVVLDVASTWADITLGHLGRIPISPALPLALLLALRIGLPALGASRAGWDRWREYGTLVVAILGAAVVLYAIDIGGAVEAGGLLVAALGEELVYRLAALVLVGAAVAAVAGRDWRDPARWGTAPGVVALLVAAFAFSLLPGHLAQTSGVAPIVPFVSLALVLGWVMLRTGALWPTVAAHAILNLVTISVLVSGAAGVLRLGVGGVTLVGLIIGADLAGRRAGRLRLVPSVIDLTPVSTRRRGGGVGPLGTAERPDPPSRLESCRHDAP